MKRAIVLSLLLILPACASNMQDINQSYSEAMIEVKQFARISAQDWLFGSGILQGALPDTALPMWVFEELRKIDAWFLLGEELTDWQLGYIVGIRLRMATPVIKAAIEQYAPGILGIAEVSAVLAFIGL